MNKLIEFQNVSFKYDNLEKNDELFAVKELSFSVNQGDFIAILGHNGSGKSTFAKLCNAILIPDSGDVLVEGMNTRDENLKFDIRKTVGMVFQNPDNQIVATIVEEDVAFGPENIGVPPKEIRVRVDEALTAVGMYDYKMHEPHKLSGGQKQRVAIAGIIAMKPKCIVLDESTAMLDPKGRREVMDTIRKLNHDFGITIVYITHYMNEAVLADKVLVMDKGRKLIEGTPKEVFSNTELIKSVGLDVPQVTDFSHFLIDNGMPLKNDILSEDDLIDSIADYLEVQHVGY